MPARRRSSRAARQAEDNIFYQLCPQPLLLPFIILATARDDHRQPIDHHRRFFDDATGDSARLDAALRITQTSKEGYGQIYVGTVNWILMVVTIGLALGFKKSDNLASAYGIAVSATMLMTTFLLFIAMREIWGWSLIASRRGRRLSF